MTVPASTQIPPDPWNLPAGPEIDKLVFGFVTFPHYKNEFPWTEATIWKVLPYSTNPFHIPVLLDFCHGDMSIERHENIWRVSIYTSTMDNYVGYGDTIQLALCRVLLAAKLKPQKEGVSR